MVTLNLQKLYELGEHIGEVLIKNKVEKQATLTISVSDDDFKKIDEDIFYKLRAKGVYSEDTEFEPSEDRIELNFNGVDIEIVK